MKFEEIFSLEIGPCCYGDVGPHEVEGFLVVTSSPSYLVASKEVEYGQLPGKGFLITQPGLDQLIISKCRNSLMVGSAVVYAGKVKITAKFTKTGMGLLPYQIYDIESLIADDQGTECKII